MLSRTNFLPRLLMLALVGAVPAVTACGAKVVSLGTTGATSDKLTSVPPTSVPTTVAGVCPTGYAHPNICCEATANEDPTCGAWENDPFRACDTGWSTYPNALSCCSLSNPTDCIDTPVDAGVVATPPPPYGCGFMCPPGWYAPASGITPGGTTVSCCQTQADGTTMCAGGAAEYPEPVSGGTCVMPPVGIGSSGGGVAYPTDASVPPEDAGVSNGPNVPVTEDGGYYDDDAGDPYACEDAGSPYPIGYDGGVASLCAPCPAGWSSNALDPVLCCQTAPNGVQECFSQATGSAGGGYGTVDGGVSTEPTPVAEDGGVVSVPPLEPTTDGGTTSTSAGVGCSGTAGSCSCQNDANGHVYVMDCSLGSNGSTTCFCETDGNVTSQFTQNNVCTTSASTEFSSSTGCGYPAF